MGAYELACNCGKIAKESYTEKYFFMSLTKFRESRSFYYEEKNYYRKQIPAHKNEKRWHCFHCCFWYHIKAAPDEKCEKQINVACFFIHLTYSLPYLDINSIWLWANHKYYTTVLYKSQYFKWNMLKVLYVGWNKWADVVKSKKSSF